MKKLLEGQIPEEYQLDYSLTFSEQSKMVYEKLIPKLKRCMKGIYNPSVTQLSNWLQSIHKHRRDQMRKWQSGQLEKDDRKLHMNARLSDVSILLIIISFLQLLLINLYIQQKKNRQIKAALRLYDENDEKIEKYDKNELLSILQINGYHSPEQSDFEDEMRSRLVTEKKFLHVYDHPWRSERVNI